VVFTAMRMMLSIDVMELPHPLPEAVDWMFLPNIVAASPP
jgi:hypothetical protein